MAPRVRFAPSPTGYLHVGGARTALFNLWFARQHGGVLLLRVEDTDRARSSEEHTRAILDGLAWLDVDFDEGPVFQADGVERHAADAWGLLESGAAYRCFCTADELAERRREAERAGAGFGYDGRCRHIDPQDAAARAAAGEACAVRFRLPGEPIAWTDMIHGPMRFEAGNVDDFVILRSNGTPVYNLAVVSDDIEDAITHVIRGDDHLSNTPKQIALYRALGAEPPAFGHVPMILGPDGKRLSKRHGAMSVTAYRDDGFLPEAMVNFLALLGWSPGDDRELFHPAELVESFSMDRVQKKSAVFDLEKLEWLNGQHIAASPAPELAERVAPWISDRLTTEPDTERLHAVLDLVKQRPRTLPLLAGQALPFLTDGSGPMEYEQAAIDRFWKRPSEVAALLRALARRLYDLAPWKEAPLETAIRGLANELDVGAGKVINPLRVALMGQAVSPGIFEVLELMGRERTLARIDRALGYLDASSTRMADGA